MRKFTEAALAVMFLAAAGPLPAYEDGAPPGHTGAFGEPDCTACHFDYDPDPPGGALRIEGWPAKALAGKRYALTVVLEHAELEGGGFQLAIRTPEGEAAGELEPASPDSQVVFAQSIPYLQHTAEGRLAAERGRIEWQFQWLAPDEAIRAWVGIAANVSNNDLSALGDRVYTLKDDTEVAAPAALTRSSRNR